MATRLPELEEVFEWSAALRVWRERRGLKQEEVAGRSGMSLSSIKAYERGRRHPSLAALQAICSALGVPGDEANRILAGAGYAIDWRSILGGRYRAPSVDEMSAEAAQYPWPAFVTNQSFEVVAANEPFERVFGVDLSREFMGFGERNLLGGITHEGFAKRLLNWDEVVTFMCGLAKGDTRWRTEDPARPAPWLEGSMQRFLEGEPARIRRFMELWESSPPIPQSLRYRFTVRWRYQEDTVLTFSGRLLIADLWSELHWNEWIPQDAETWAELTIDS